MARGWESKSVEDQIAAAQALSSKPVGASLSAAELAREQRRLSLQLARTRALQDLAGACDKRHRALLQETLAHLDSELAAL
ncbi:MAG: hypothetical protein ABI652_00705 [Acidobacteriota bacterium]